MRPYYAQDGITIYHGDCREVLPGLGRFDLLLTDPPYGIDWNAENQNLPGATKRAAIQNDSETELARWICANLWQFDHAVIFGANCFPNVLPHRGRWICWDKRTMPEADKMLGSPFELAWTNRQSGYDRMIRKLHGGVVNADGGKRLHPTQKPSGLFRTILADYAVSTVADPFMGSGSTLLAAKLEGLSATGIELEERYCEVAAGRLEQQVFAFS